MNGSAENQCEKTRHLVELRIEQGAQALAPDEAAYLESHLKNCTACVQWQTQMQDIIAVARVAPQFDVSEALTQRILSSVKGERLSAAASVAQVAALLVLLAAGAGVFLADSTESLYGLGSWCVGLAAMFLLQTIIAGGRSGKQAGW